MSPIKSHPGTAVLEETISSVRHHLPDSEIVLMFDGVRAEQEHMRAAYEEATRRTLWLAKSWGAVCPFVFDRHLHQVGMLRAVLDEIRTPLMLFVEADTPLEKDPIDWATCCDLITSRKADVVRMYHESAVPPEHEYLMREQRGDFLHTVQWSQRPHLASVEYYRRALEKYFTPEANCFVEDVMHGACQAWPDEHKLFIYTPEGGYRRSFHSDGRAGEPKWDDQQTF